MRLVRMLLVAATVVLAACPAPRTTGGDGADAGGTVDTDCADCLTDADCQGGRICVQVGAGAGCLMPCEGGFCEGGETCEIGVDNAGLQKEVCAGSDDPCVRTGTFDCSSCASGTVCNALLGRCDPATDGGTPGDQACGTFVGPDASGTCCTSCQPSSGNCQANGCYGGWWCDTSACRCHAPPTTCEGTGDGSGGTDGGTSSGGTDGGTSSGGTNWAGDAVTGTVGHSGGTVSRLYFAVVGDTRPDNPDETNHYPSAVIRQIYGDVAALSPSPSFAVATGDYMYATPGRGTALPQLQLYTAAQALFAGPVFHALGNHECTGYTKSECGSGNTDGETENYQAFVTEFLTPIGQTKPYYALDFTGADGSWTAKVVVVAANAWTSAQSAWLDQELAKPTTFTFVVRHEPSDDTKCPGTQASETIIRRHPVTLEIFGHTHEFRFERPGTYTPVPYVIVGNGGAPLTGGDYGYATVSQVSPTDVVVAQYDYSSSVPSHSWTVGADGSVH